MSEMSDDDFLSGGSEEDFNDESMDSDFEEEDGTQYLDDKDDRPQKKAYEVDYSVLSEEQIEKAQSDMIDEVHIILDLTPENAAMLLRHFKWNKERLIEQYMDSSQRVLEYAGIDLSGSNKLEVKKVPGFVCDICCEDGDDLDTIALRCNHRYCTNCYQQYLFYKIREEGEAIMVQCLNHKCKVLVDPSTIERLCTPEILHRYHELLNRTYVQDKQNLRWCPAPNCENVIDCGVTPNQLQEIVPTVMCTCGHHFCFGCGSNDHQPCPCGLVRKWLKKCEDDSETANWISANTKECPKCQSTIEKNGGCNHMTCRKCKHEFCWVCMGPWNEHGTSWYNCNRYEEKSGVDARDIQAKSRASLERYLHYYNRYANHEQSGKLDKDLYIKTEKKMTMLQSASGMSWIEVQYLDAASKVLQQCRQTLKWTYAFAFYLQRNHLTTIFEDNQKDLEMAVEGLSELFEKPTDQLANIKVEMMDKTAYVSNRRVILLDTTAKGLQDGTWEFTVEF